MHFTKWNRKECFRAMGTLCTVFDDWAAGSTLRKIQEIVIDKSITSKSLSFNPNLSRKYTIHIFTLCLLAFSLHGLLQLYQNWNLDSGGHNNPNKKTPRGSRISKGTEQKWTGQLNFSQYRHCFSNTKYLKVYLFLKIRVIIPPQLNWE